MQTCLFFSFRLRSATPAVSIRPALGAHRAAEPWPPALAAHLAPARFGTTHSPRRRRRGRCRCRRSVLHGCRRVLLVDAVAAPTTCGGDGDFSVRRARKGRRGGGGRETRSDGFVGWSVFRLFRMIIVVGQRAGIFLAMDGNAVVSSAEEPRRTLLLRPRRWRLQTLRGQPEMI